MTNAVLKVVACLNVKSCENKRQIGEDEKS